MKQNTIQNEILTKSQTKSQKVKLYIVLHLLLMMFSVMGICSKTAANQEFMSFPFLFYYGLMLAILAVYAVAWQQIIKRLPLTTAFANKAVTVVWGMVWGVVAFREHISLNKVIGSVIIILGIVLYSKAGEPEGGLAEKSKTQLEDDAVSARGIQTDESEKEAR